MSKDFRDKRAIMEYDLSERKTRTWTIEEAMACFNTDIYTLGDVKDRIMAMYIDKHREMDYDTLEASYNLAFDVPPKGVKT